MVSTLHGPVTYGYTDSRTCIGVNTGVGGSADTRTMRVVELQRELVRKLHCGVLLEPGYSMKGTKLGQTEDIVTLLAKSALPVDDPTATTCMPEAWVRASMLIRLNSLSSGASGIKLSTVRTLLQLLENDVVPRIPIRGSISASGDLSPLSYIAGVMQGKPTLKAWCGSRLTDQRRLVRADIALAEHSIQPVQLVAKEGLAIVNGTAISAAVGALAIHDALFQAGLSQVLTAMSVEALCGTDESFDPFFAKVRPHPGQIEAAQNIFAFLEQSKLIFRDDGSEEASLRQDRYSIRTAAQWIGPALEDLQLAYKQLVTEINSVTDNPLVDTKGNRMLHGGNFQAKSVTSAMEKTRQACQTIGRMLFVQCTELLNPPTNRGLPPNLSVDEPSDAYTFKGIDLMIAAFQSELGFLANPVGSHVQTAEMGNQALNSLALISGRYTLDALGVLSQLSAAHLFSMCQALDLRAMNIRFFEAFQSTFNDMVKISFESYLNHHNGESLAIKDLQKVLFAVFKKRFDQTTTIDSAKRFASIVEFLQPTILRYILPTAESLTALNFWTTRCSATALQIYATNRDHYCKNPDATPFLGSASRRMYAFIRDELSVPFMRIEAIATPYAEPSGPQLNGNKPHALDLDEEPPTMGTYMTAIYQSMRSGALYSVVVDCLREVPQGSQDGKSQSLGAGHPEESYLRGGDIMP